MIFLLPQKHAFLPPFALMYSHKCKKYKYMYMYIYIYCTHTSKAATYL